MPMSSKPLYLVKPALEEGRHVHDLHRKIPDVSITMYPLSHSTASMWFTITTRGPRPLAISLLPRSPNLLIRRATDLTNRS
jgi:hypothetical protein